MKFISLSCFAVLVLGTVTSAAPTGQRKTQNYIIQLNKDAAVDDCKNPQRNKRMNNSLLRAKIVTGCINYQIFILILNTQTNNPNTMRSLYINL